MKLEIGLNNTLIKTVDESMLATSFKSGMCPVLATPVMIALMEQCAAESVEDVLDDGLSTVGTHIDVRHLKATPLGMKVNVTSSLIDINDCELVFSVEARDEKDMIGSGLHRRFIIDKEKFTKKTNEKGLK